MSTDAALPTGLADVLARVAALQAMTTAPRTTTTAAGTTSTASTAGAPFATALQAAVDSGASTAAPAAAANVAMSGFTSATGPTTSAVDGGEVVATAARYLGVPYQWGGTDPATGLDCSGLVQRTFADLGVDLPRTTYDQVKAGAEVPTLAAAEPGDLVFFGSPPEHVGIYVGNGQMLDAPHTGARVRIEPVWSSVSAIRRIAGSPTAAASGSPGTPYAAAFAQAGARYGVDPKLLSALAQEESGFDPNAVSGAGAQGLMQLMPSTAASLGVNALDPSQAIDGAARLLSGYLRSYGGSVDLALAAYSAGSGAVARYGGVPPYAETQNAIRKVRAIYEGNRA